VELPIEPTFGIL